MRKDKVKTFNVAWNWIEFAHGPGADSYQTLARVLCDLPINKRGQVEIPRCRRDLIVEVQSVAGLYVGGRDSDPQAARLIARCKKALA